MTSVTHHHDAAPAPANPMPDSPAPESLAAAARAVLMTGPARAKADPWVRVGREKARKQVSLGPKNGQSG